MKAEVESVLDFDGNNGAIKNNVLFESLEVFILISGFLETAI